MKQSKYNTIVSLGKQQVLYNTITNKFVVLSDAIKEALKCETVSPLSLKLESNNYLVKDDVDEKQMIESLFVQRRFSSKVYQLTLNTSLDCNLCCWYCYETHAKKTNMSLELVKNILLHLEIKSQADPFKILELSFFGGEPLLNYKAIKALLEGVKMLSERFDFDIHLTFVTNGTLINQKYVELLKEFKVRFQITIDGNKDTHNNTRKYKSKLLGTDSYGRIMDNLKLLNEQEAEFYFIVRVNYETDTLKSISKLMADLEFLDKRRTALSLHRVWQHKATEEDSALLIDAINYINSMGFVVSTFPLATNLENCYADNYNQAIINYDGNVYKCTARDFSSEQPSGKLNSLGLIEWNAPLLLDRLALDIPQKCKDCLLLPSCTGICSQKKVEAKDNEQIPCPFEDLISKEDVILLNIKQQLVIKKYEKENSDYAHVAS
jgi:uncharacterized protein